MTTFTISHCCIIIAADYPEKMDELDRLLLEDSNFTQKFAEVGSRTIRILITGKTGTGKSALINGIIGTNASKEGGLLNPTTSKVEEYKRSARGVKMLVYDSPGLQDGTKNEKAYLLDMEKKCKGVDLVLYTIRMSDQRINVGDIEAMKKLNTAFGEKFWARTMFILTFANEIRDPEDPEDESSNQAFFEKRLRTWKQKLPDTAMKNLSISKKVAKSIPIVPAGYHKTIHLPGRRFWFSQFWKAMFDRMREYTNDGSTFLLQFNKDRFKRAYEVTSEDFKKDIHKQPIVKESSRRSSTLGAKSNMIPNYLFADFLSIGSLIGIAILCLCIYGRG